MVPPCAEPLVLCTPVVQARNEKACLEQDMSGLVTLK